MSESKSRAQTDGPKTWPPRLDDVRDMEAIVDALDEEPDIEDVRLKPEHREFTTHIVVRLGGGRPSTTELSDLYRDHDLRSTWASIHPTGDLSFSIEAKPSREVTDA